MVRGAEQDIEQAAILGVDAPGGLGGHRRIVMSERVRQHVVVTGHVQGVFFRESTRREAARRGVAGWVCNRGDGAVEAVFEGSPDDVRALVEFCSRGPGGAVVRDVTTSDEEPEGLSGFEVR